MTQHLIYNEDIKSKDLYSIGFIVLHKYKNNDISNNFLPENLIL